MKLQLLHLSAILSLLFTESLSAATFGIAAFEGVVEQSLSFSANAQGSINEIQSGAFNILGPDLTGYRIAGTILINFDLMPAPVAIPNFSNNPSFPASSLEASSLGIQTPEWMTATFVIEAPLPLHLTVQRDQGFVVPPDTLPNFNSLDGSQRLQKIQRAFDSNINDPDNPLVPCCEAWEAAVNNFDSYSTLTSSAVWRSNFFISLFQTSPVFFAGPVLTSAFNWPSGANPLSPISNARIQYGTQLISFIGLDPVGASRFDWQLVSHDIRFQIDHFELQIVEDIPEPGSLILLSSGLFFLAYKSRQQ